MAESEVWKIVLNNSPMWGRVCIKKLCEMLTDIYRRRHTHTHIHKNTHTKLSEGIYRHVSGQTHFKGVFPTSISTVLATYIIVIGTNARTMKTCNFL